MELKAEETVGNSKVTLADMIKFDYLNQASWSNADSLNTVIGQGQNAYTPIQMARYMAMIANGGQKLKTSVIEKIVSHDNKTVSFQNNPETEKSTFNRALSSIWAGCREVMRGQGNETGDGATDSWLSV